MTAEVAVINKSAVAIAADSARTIKSIGSNNSPPQKIFNTANKVFALSKYAPLGIMVYNAADLGGVPWETLIKMYREHLKQKKFDYLDHYVDDLFKFLCNNETLFNEEQIKDNLFFYLLNFFSHLSQEIDSNQNVRAVFDKQIEKMEKAKFAVSFDESDTKLSQDYKTVVDKAANRVFESAKIKNIKRKYRRLAALAITKETRLGGYSGVVITGFGEKEIFPKLVEYRTDLVIFNKIKKFRLQEYTQNHIKLGKVMSFAQDDITRTILDGINPNYAFELLLSAYRILNILPQKIIDGIDELDQRQKEFYKSLAQDASLESTKKFFRIMDHVRQEKHTFQIEEAIKFMPFSELAEVAELFIRLTQVRRRLSLDSETVGGPIDVAVISKADGFIWTKRKFYFSKELNYSFIGNYLDHSYGNN